MSDEIRINLTVQVVKGSYKENFEFKDNLDQTTAGAASGVQSVGTTEENLFAGDVATMGWLAMRNIDATNYVDWGVSDAGTMKAVGRMKPGDPAFLRVRPGVSVRLKADTAACNVQFLLLND